MCQVLGFSRAARSRQAREYALGYATTILSTPTPPVVRRCTLISIFVTQVHKADQVEDLEAFKLGPHQGNLLHCYKIQPRYGKKGARVINSKGNRNVCTYVNGNKSTPNVVLRARCLFATCTIEVGAELLLKYPYDPTVEQNNMISGGKELPAPTIRVPTVNMLVELKFNKRVVRIATFDHALRIRRI